MPRPGPRPPLSARSSATSPASSSSPSGVLGSGAWTVGVMRTGCSSSPFRPEFAWLRRVLRSIARFLWRRLPRISRRRSSGFGLKAWEGVRRLRVWVQVEVCFVAVAGEGGVAPFAVEVFAAQDVRVIDARSLQSVRGRGISVVQVPCVQVGRVESGRLTGVGLDRKRAALEIDVGDAGACAVRDAELMVVAARQHAITFGERALTEGELRVAEALVGVHALPRPLVEVGDVRAAVGDHHRVLTTLRVLPPVVDHPFANLAGGGCCVDAFVLAVGAGPVG